MTAARGPYNLGGSATRSGTNCRVYNLGYPQQETWAAPSGTVHPITSRLVAYDTGRRTLQGF
jgi:hypothetical protein